MPPALYTPHVQPALLEGASTTSYDNGPLADPLSSAVLQPPVPMDCTGPVASPCDSTPAQAASEPQPVQGYSASRSYIQFHLTNVQQPVLYELRTEGLPSSMQEHLTHLNAAQYDLSTSAISAYFPRLESLVVRNLHVDSGDKLPESLGKLFILESILVSPSDATKSRRLVETALYDVKHIYFDDYHWAFNNLVCRHPGCDNFNACRNNRHPEFVHLCYLDTLSLRALTDEDCSLIQHIIEGLAWSTYLRKHVHIVHDPATPGARDGLSGFSQHCPFYYTLHTVPTPLAIVLWELDSRGRALGVWEGTASTGELARLKEVYGTKRVQKRPKRVWTKEPETRYQAAYRRFRTSMGPLSSHDNGYWNSLHDGGLGGQAMYRLIASHESDV
ncbi:hypothetical protein EXIGLDRAFT_728318 [Exidia glandulosa HHB12029]|uniref:Uncharacterized protein n=1 Tax=Exidia glandulosa HHB12029 TaxID=1314781 RepID=A0A165LT95_EXIGL|nr:hypothetical protein EXIGLDRAFT_728318 [Exidia glandulosa HHB12029]